MTKALAYAVFAVSVVTPATNSDLGSEKQYCADCPFIVKKSLEGVPGVAKVTVSYKDKTAIVTYDGSKADMQALTDATTKAGYPSAPSGSTP